MREREIGGKRKREGTAPQTKPDDKEREGRMMFDQISRRKETEEWKGKKEGRKEGRQD